MKYTHILAIDPSGNYKEGYGTTGWVLLDAKTEKLISTGAIYARDYSCPEEYWAQHVKLLKDNIERYKNNRFNDKLIIVIENYVLYRDRAKNQTNSELETPRLIGLLQYYCWQKKQDYSFQLASSVKDRWSDSLLQREHIMYRNGNRYLDTKTNMNLSSNHIRDAYRHALHYAITRNETKERKKYDYTGAKKSNYQERPWQTETLASSNSNNTGYRKSERIRSY